MKVLFAYLNLNSKVSEIEHICRRPIQQQKASGESEAEVNVLAVNGSESEHPQMVEHR